MLENKVEGTGNGAKGRDQLAEEYRELYEVRVLVT